MELHGDEERPAAPNESAQIFVPIPFKANFAQALLLLLSSQSEFPLLMEQADKEPMLVDVSIALIGLLTFWNVATQNVAPVPVTEKAVHAELFRHPRPASSAQVTAVCLATENIACIGLCVERACAEAMQDSAPSALLVKELHDALILSQTP